MGAQCGGASRQRLVSARVCAALVLALAPAAAQTPATVRLEYLRAAGAERCPDASRIHEAVAAQLGRSAFRDDAAASVRVVLSRDGSQWVASLTARDGEGALVGSRDLRVASANCRDVTDALAFALGLAVESLTRRALSTTASARLPSTLPPAPTAPPPSTVTVPAVAEIIAPPPAATVPPRTRQPTRWQFGLGVDGGIAGGVVPGGSMTIAAAFELRRGLWGAELAAGYVLPGTTSGSVPGSSASIDALRASLGPCAWISVVRVCVPVTAARVSGKGIGVATPLDDALPSVRLGLRVDVRLGVVGGVEFRLVGAASAAVVRESFRLGGQTVWTSALVDGWGGVALRYVL